MRTQTIAAAIAVAVSFSACQQPSSDSAGDAAATLAALEQVRDQHVAAILGENVEEELATYTESAVVVPPGHQGAVGTQEIRAWLQGTYDSFTVEQLEIDLADHTVQEDLAVAHYRYRWSVAPEGEGEPVPDTGQGLWVLERQPDGRWLIAYDIWNSDGGTAESEQ